MESANAQGASIEHLEIITAAQNALILQKYMARGNKDGFSEFQLLEQVVEEIRLKLVHRNNLSPAQRVNEELLPCTLFND